MVCWARLAFNSSVATASFLRLAAELRPPQAGNQQFQLPITISVRQLLTLEVNLLVVGEDECSEWRNWAC